MIIKSDSNKNTGRGTAWKKICVFLLSVMICMTMTPASFAAKTTNQPAAEGPAAVSESTATEENAATEESDTGNAESSATEEGDASDAEAEPELANRTIVSEGEDYSIKVTGDLPQDAQLQVTEIASETEDYGGYVKSAAEKVFEKDKTVVKESLPYARFFDISILYNEGQSIFEPADKVKMVIDTQDDALKTKDVDFAAVHFQEEGEAEIVRSKVEDQKVMSLNAASFSVYGVVYYYTVDFYYTAEKAKEAAEYHMNGGSEMMMSQLFDELGIKRDTADIEKVEFTDESLLTVTAEDGDYRIRSLKPFRTSEMLTLTFKDGKTIFITTRDAQNGIFPSGTCTWTINDSGVLTIKGPGTLPSASDVGNPPSDGKLKQYWPYYEYKNDITSVVIEEGVASNQEARGMFAKLPNLKTADLSKLDARLLGCANDMFRDCTSLTEITLPGSFAPRQAWRMCMGCSELTTLTIGSTDDPFSPSATMAYREEEGRGYMPSFQQFDTDGNDSYSGREAFSGCTKLTTLNLPGAIIPDDNGNNINTRHVQKLFQSFNRANSELKTINMEGADLTGTNEKSALRSMFKLDTLDTLNLSGSTIHENNLRVLFHNVNNQLNISDYTACQALRDVDMTNVSFEPSAPPNLDYGTVSALNMFKGLQGLETVDMSGAVFPDGTTTNPEGVKYKACTSFQQMFDDCTNLKSVIMAKTAESDLNVKGATNMQNVFRGCSSLEYLDISGFGELPNITNMNGFLGADNKNCTALKTLIIDNLDNSVIQPRRGSDHEHASDGRMMFTWGDPSTNLPKLETVSATNSKVWFVKDNNVGLPSAPEFNVGNETNMYYLSKSDMEFKSDEGPTVTIDSKRDWIDLWTDHYGQSSGSSSIPDAEKNINYNGGKHLNTNGAGFLAPGVYTITKNKWNEPKLELEETFYRISNINTSNPTAVVSDARDRIKLSGGLITTNTYTKDEWNGSSVFDSDGNDRIVQNADGTPVATITYPDAAEDIYGKKHDVIVKVNSITFKDIDRIKESENVQHDPNHYLDDRPYYRPVIRATEGDLTFINEAYNSSHQKIITDGSGTFIDFDVEIKDALTDTSVLFYMEDLDHPARQIFRPGVDPVDGVRDWHFAELPFHVKDGYGVTYGHGSEGMILGNGNDLSTVAFADHTGLEKINGNEIVPTGSDPSTAWSSFAVRADAKGSNYTWTSGVACETQLLRQTAPPDGPDPVYVMPEALKRVNGIAPSGTYANGYFKFNFKKANNVTPTRYTDYAGTVVDPTGLNNKAADQDEKSNKKDVVVFDTLALPSPESTDKQLYIYEITEKAGSTEDDIMEYDDNKYYMQVVVSDPITDLELYKGTRAEIVLGKASGGNVVWDTDRTITVWANDAQLVEGETGPGGAQVFKDANGTMFYRDMTSGDLKPYGSTDELTKTKRAQEEKTVYFDHERKDKEVYVDHNGVEYIKGDDGRYYDPDNQQPLLTPKTGDIDSERVKKDHVISIKDTVDVDGTTYELREDIHGVVYYENEGRYYDRTGTELTVKDGEFNPNTGDNEDKYLYKNRKHTYQGTEYDVYEHFNGKEYIKVPDGTGFKYINPENDEEWEIKSTGDVDPQDTDEKATVDKYDYKERKETVTGRSNTIKKDKNGVEYFKNVKVKKTTTVGDDDFDLKVDKNGVEYYEDGGKYYAPDGIERTVEEGIFEPADGDEFAYNGDDKYYTPYNTLLETRTGVFEPDDNEDKPVYHTYEVWVDSEGNEFYKNERKYFDMNGKEVKLSKGTLDTSEIIDVATFHNKIKTSDITIKKEVESGAAQTGGKFKFLVTFDTNYSPLKANYQFDPGSVEEPVQTSSNPNTWEFVLEEGQQVVIKDVPLQTKYSIVEEAYRGAELSKIETGESKTTGEVKDVTITKTLDDDDYEKDYEHTFTNKITQVIVDKEVTNLPAGVDVSDKEFTFTAEVTKTGLSDGEEFSFGWLQEDNSSEFKTAKYSDGSLTGNTITFTLKDGEDIALVIPDGADVKVTETTESYIPFTKIDDGSEKDGNVETLKNVKNKDPLTTLHFINKYVTPVDYDEINVEKVIDNHHFMNGYEFEMALFPSETTHTPMPEETVSEAGGEGEYAPVIIKTDDPETEDGKGYRDTFDSITFTNEDMMEVREGKWEQVQEKIFTYYIRELTPPESQSGYRVPGLTYSTERYQADVKVKLNREESKLELVVESTTIYKMNYDSENDKWVADKSKPLTAARFTNKYDPNTSAYRMTADKFLTSTDDTKTLQDREYTFVMKPAGDNAAKAPMPKNTQGEGANRYLEVVNYQHMVKFLDESDDSDGLKFNHTALNEAGFTDEQLESTDGVVFEYELYEKIPDGAKNNNDGTWTVTDSEGNTTVYDGIHHMRKLLVRLIENPDYKPLDPSYGPEKIISVDGHPDDNAEDFYINKDGEQKPASGLSGYVPAEHHTKGGAPIFHNYYFHQQTGELVIKKSWDDYDDMDEIRPDRIHVKVTSEEDNPFKKTVALHRDESGHWTTTVADLPIYSDKYDRATKSMEKIEYKVEEVMEGVIDGTAEGYVVSYDTEMPFEIKEKDTEDPNYEPVEVTVINRHMPIPGAADSDETWGLKNQPQRGTPDYEVVSTDPMIAEHLVIPDIPGAYQDKEGWVIIPGEGKYYLNKDDVQSVTFIPEKDYVGDPTPIEIHCKDKLGNEQNVTYTPHVLEPEVETETITRTVHFTYLDKEGKEVTDKVVQTVTVSRQWVSVDPKTGKDPVWGEWTSATFPAVPNPDKEAGEGWTTNDLAPELTIKGPTEVPDVYVVYHKKTYTVKYLNGAHGRSTGGSTIKEYGDTPQSNTVTPSKGYKFTGKYNYVITDENGKVIARGTTSDPGSIKVIGNIVFTPIYEKVSNKEDCPDCNNGDKDKKGNKDSSDGSSGTGDQAMPFVIGGMMLLAAIAIAAMLIRRRRSI